MNKARRERLQEALSIVEAASDEEQEALDNLPESLQAAERGEAMQEAIDALEEARSALETAIEAGQ